MIVSKTGVNVFTKAFANLRRSLPVPKKIDRSILGFVFLVNQRIYISLDDILYIVTMFCYFYKLICNIFSLLISFASFFVKHLYRVIVILFHSKLP